MGFFYQNRTKIQIVIEIGSKAFKENLTTKLTSMGEKFPIDFAEGFFVNNSIWAFLKRRRKMELLASFFTHDTWGVHKSHQKKEKGILNLLKRQISEAPYFLGCAQLNVEILF